MGLLGLAMFEVTLADSRKVHRHGDQFRSRPASDQGTPVVDESSEAGNDDFDITIPNLRKLQNLSPRT